MMASQHTYGDSCMLKEESNTFTRRASSVAIDPPKITAQFFYCSSLPIDDPLAAVPAPSGNVSTRSSRVPPRPFSVHDNLALDQAWLQFQKTSRRYSTNASAQERRRSRARSTKQRQPSSSELYAASVPPQMPDDEPHTDNYMDERIFSGKQRARENSLGTQAIKSNDAGSDENTGQLRSELIPEERPSRNDEAIHEVDHQVLQDTVPVTAREITQDEVESGVPQPHRSRSFFHRKEKIEKLAEDIVSPRSSTRRLSRGRQAADESPDVTSRSPDTTGTPFLRIPSRLRRSRSRSRSPHRDVQDAQIDGAPSPEMDYRPKQSSPLGMKPRFAEFTSSQESQEKDMSNLDDDFQDYGKVSGRRRKSKEFEAVQVTVGISRLHVVEMPNLKVSLSRRGKLIGFAKISIKDGTNILGPSS